MGHLPEVENYEDKEKNNVVKFEEALDMYKYAFEIVRDYMEARYMNVTPFFYPHDFDKTKVNYGQINLSRDFDLRHNGKDLCFSCGFTFDCVWLEKLSSFKSYLSDMYFEYSEYYIGVDFLTPLFDDIERFEEFSISFFGKRYSNPFMAFSEEVKAVIDVEKLEKHLCALMVEENERRVPAD